MFYNNAHAHNFCIAMLRWTRVATAAARGPRPAATTRASLCTRSSGAQPGSPSFEDPGSEKALRLALKTLALSWFGYKGYSFYAGGDTFFVSSALQLVRSKHADYQASGVSRLDRWHHSDEALVEIVKCGGVAALLKTLRSPEPSTRLLSLKILVNLAPVGTAQSELVAGNAATAAESSCAGMSVEEDAARCRELSHALREALLG